jgi:hypothetical protein
MRARNFVGDKGREACYAENLTTIFEPTVGTLTSQNPTGLHGLLLGYFFFFKNNKMKQLHYNLYTFIGRKII